jgi:hypothetical protein
MGIYKITKDDSVIVALERASIANAVAKTSKINEIVVFTEEMQNKLIQEKEILTTFENAINNTLCY